MQERADKRKIGRSLVHGTISALRYFRALFLAVYDACWIALLITGPPSNSCSQVEVSAGKKIYV